MAPGIQNWKGYFATIPYLDCIRPEPNVPRLATTSPQGLTAQPGAMREERLPDHLEINASRSAAPIPRRVCQNSRSVDDQASSPNADGSPARTTAVNEGALRKLHCTRA
jgi:hypothetical protein